MFCARQLGGTRLAVLFGADPGAAAHSAELLAEVADDRPGLQAAIPLAQFLCSAPDDREISEYRETCPYAP